MNVTRIAILGVAATAAGAAALLVRGMLGGQTAPVEASVAPPPAITTDVLVLPRQCRRGASSTWALYAGIMAEDFGVGRVHHQGRAARHGQSGRRHHRARAARLGPADHKSQHGAQRHDGIHGGDLMPGMRAVAMPVAADTGAGGFLLPNDRVDVILTHDVANGNQGGEKVWRSDTILQDVRLLAIDQVAEPASAGGSAVGDSGPPRWNSHGWNSHDRTRSPRSARWRRSNFRPHRPSFCIAPAQRHSVSDIALAGR